MADRFQTTRWSIVLSAGQGGEASREALEWLCTTYWYPLYAFVRRQGHDADTAQDLTQAFFVSLLEHDSFRKIDPQRGKFRAFLLASIKHFLSNQRAHDRARQRRTNDPAFRINLDDAEQRYSLETDVTQSPDELFESRWARSVLDRVLHRMSEEYEIAGKGRIFRGLKGRLTGEDPPYHQIAEKLEMSQGALRLAVHRLRLRLGTLLREEVAQTIANPEDVDAELRSLLEAAGRIA